MSVDASEHIGVLHYVVNSATMNIPFHMRDEAISEGYVLLVQAAASYDSRYNTPPHYWIAMKIRNGLKNWKKKESHLDAEGNLSWEEYKPLEAVDPEDHPGYEPQAIWEKRQELERLLDKAVNDLTHEQFVALIGPAFGLHMKELSHLLKKNPNQIIWLQEQARRALYE